MFKAKPATLRNATTLAAIGLLLQGVAFFLPYMEYFELVTFGNWFLFLALALNVLSILFLLYFFLVFYKSFLVIIRSLHATQDVLDPAKKK